MRDRIIYRHWRPGDDDAILELLLPAEQFGISRANRRRK